MDEFLKWFATSPVASFLRSALAVVLTLMIADFVKAGAFDVANWQLWVIGGLSAALPALLRWLNPSDTLGVR
jgi:hypothetical protein